MSESRSKRVTLQLPRRKAADEQLLQQKADFTAEGSPPPGRVAGNVPTTAAPASDASDAGQALPKV